jgi:hypothetical protein
MGELIEFDSKPTVASRDRRRFGWLTLGGATRATSLPEDPPTQSETAEILKISQTPEDSDRGALSAARGICLAIALAVVIWALVAYGIWRYALS